MAYVYLVLYFVTKTLAASIIQELGNVYLIKNETFQANLNDYFEGEFLNFSVYYDKTAESYLLGEYFFGLNLTYPVVEDDEYGVVAVHTYFDIGIVLCAKNMQVYFFHVNLMTGIIEFAGNLSIQSELEQSEIIDGVIVDDFAYVAVRGIERINGSEFYANEVICIKTSNFMDYYTIPTWNVKYLDELSMSIESKMFLAFWGELYNQSIIFLYSIDQGCLSLLYEINQFSINNSTEPQTLSILDLFLHKNQIFVLDKNFGVIVYEYIDMTVSNKIVPIVHFGHYIRFSKNNLQVASLLKFGIVMDTGIIVVDISLLIVNNYIEVGVSGDTQCQISNPYLFVYSNEMAELYVIRIYDYEYSTLHLIPYNNSLGPAIILRDSRGYILIKLIQNEVQHYILNFTENILEVSSEHNSTIIVSAQDHKSTINSTMHIKIIEDLFTIYPIYNYRETDPDSLNQMVYLDGIGYQAPLNISTTFSGWNYSTSIYSFRNEVLDYVLLETFPVNLLENLQFNRNYTSGCLTSMLYTINSDGVYMNESLIIDDKYPIQIIRVVDSIAVLYSNYTLYYEINNGSVINATYNSSCASVFKSVFTFIFCSDTEKLLIIQSTVVKRNYLLKFITNGENIIDVSYIKNDLKIGDYLYLLTNTHVYFYLFYKGSLSIEKIVKSNASFITHGEQFLYFIGENIEVYNSFLDTHIKTIPLNAVPTSIYNHKDVLYVQLPGEFYVFNGVAPVIQSLIYSEPTNNCQVHQSRLNTILLLCQDSGTIFKDLCDVTSCYPEYKIKYTVIEPSAINEGDQDIIISATLNGVNSIVYQNILHTLNTYSLVLNFDQSNLPSSLFIIDYDQSLTIALSDKFEGFNINYMLYINNTRVETVNPWLSLSPRVINNYYLSNPDQTFLDHQYLKNENVVLVLCTNSIILYKVDESFRLNSTFTPQVIKIIYEYEYLPFEGGCSSIKYVSTKNNLALFALSCYEIARGDVYFDGYLSRVASKVYLLVFFELNIDDYTLNSVENKPMSHPIDWLIIITSSMTKFAIVCIDYITTIVTESNANNNIYSYVGTWDRSISLTKFKSVNFNTLGLARMRVNCADGYYDTNVDSIGMLYLYVTDKFYGIRVIEISQNNASLIWQISYTTDIVISIGICGNTLFLLTGWTDIDQYFIDNFYIPHFYTTFQPSYNSNYKGVSSVISCSSYYRPKYLAIYIYSVPDNFYQLRFIDLKTSVYGSYIKFFNLTGNTNPNYKAQSLFVTENMVTALGGQSGELFTFLISDLEITFPQMNTAEYKDMVKIWGSNSFELMIEYNNEYNEKNSSKYLIKRLGPSSDDDDDGNDDSKNLWWIWLIGAFVLVVLVVVSFVMYKRVFGNNRKKAEQVEMKDIISFVGRYKNPRMSMMSLVSNGDL